MQNWLHENRWRSKPGKTVFEKECRTLQSAALLLQEQPAEGTQPALPLG